MNKSKIFIFLLLISSFSCNRKCAENVCGNHGICQGSTGACICESGYEGQTCDTKWSNKFIFASGWLASDTVKESTAGSTIGPLSYVTYITELDADMLRVSSLSALDSSASNFTLLNPTSFNINFTDSAGRLYTGTGSLNSDLNAISISYRINYPNTTFDEVSGIWLKN